MVKLPQVEIERSVTQGAQSRISGGEIQSAFGALSAGLDSLAGKFEAAATEEAALEGQNAVYRDETGAIKYKTKSNFSPSGRAYNRAARTAALANFADDSTTRMQEFVLKANGDVSVFDGLAKAYLDDTVGRQDKLMQGPVKLQLQGDINLARRGLIEAATRNDLAANEAAIKAHLENTEAEMAALAREGGTATPEYLKKMDEVKSLYGELASNPAFKTNQREIDARIKRVTAQHTGEWVLGRISDVYEEGGIEAAQKFIDEGLNDPGLALTPAERLRYRRQGTTFLNARKAEHKADQVALRKEAKEYFDGYTKGIAQEEGLVDDMIARLEAAGDPSTALRLRRARYRQEYLSDFSAADNATQLANIEQMENKIRAGGGATGLIKKFEGFSNTPYWDVNAYRAGYGSDTVTKADGTVVRVEKGMWVSREDAERDMIRRSAEFAKGAAGQVGADKWNALPRHVQSALTSIAYNYGSLPERIIPAVQSGDVAAIAEAVRGLGGDNNGINRKRRNTEAAIIDGKGAGGYNSDDIAIYKEGQKEVLSDAKNGWGSIKKGMLKGDPMSPDEMEVFRRQVRAGGDQDFMREVDTFLQSRIGEAPGMTPLQQQNVINEIMADGVDPDEVEILDGMRTIHKNTVDTLEKDPLDLVNRNPNYGKPLAPLDGSSAESFAASLRDRQKAVNFIGVEYGREVGALRPAEVDALANTLAQAPVPDKVALLRAMSETLDPDTYRATAEQLYNKAGPVMGTAGALMQKDPQAAESIVRGEQYLRENPKLAPTGEKSEDYTAMNEKIPMSAFAVELLEAREDFKAAARAVYADLSVQSADDSGVLNEDRWATAVNTVTGGFVEYNGKKVIAPEYGMPQQDFDGLMSNLRDRDIEGATYLGGGAIVLETILRDGILTSAGDGQYFIQLKTGVPLIPGIMATLPYVQNLVPLQRPSTSGATTQKFILDLTPEARAMRDRQGGFTQFPEQAAAEQGYEQAVDTYGGGSPAMEQMVRGQLRPDSEPGAPSETIEPPPPMGDVPDVDPRLKKMLGIEGEQ